LHIALLFWALLIIYSRVYLGVHYPADVIAGAILGYGIGLSTGTFFKYLNDKI
jgi:undecaprenyl-diphosphatase